MQQRRLSGGPAPHERIQNEVACGAARKYHPFDYFERLLCRMLLALRVLPPGTSYVFNPSGQTIDASGLLALFDADGPCGTPVKDAQRTKTHAATRAAIAIVWGSRALPGRAAAATAWYRALVAPLGAVEDVALSASP